jgi:hypothetical protein
VDDIKAALGTLTKRLHLHGKRTPEVRKAWIETVLGRPLSTASALTKDDIAKCLEQIDRDTETLRKATEIAKRVFRIS